MVALRNTVKKIQLDTAKTEEIVINMPLTACLYTELRAPQNFGTPRQKCKRLSTWTSTLLLNKIPIIIPIIVIPPKLAPSQ